MDLIVILAAFAAGFVVGICWHWIYARDARLNRYRIPARPTPVLLGVGPRYPRPGLPCHNLHGTVPAGERCPVCGMRIGVNQHHQ